MKTKEFQAKVFSYIKEILPENKDLKTELMDTLYLSEQSVYKLLNGETNLKLEYLLILTKKYKISIDGIMGKTTPSAYFELYKAPIDDIESYVKEMGRLSLEIEKIVSSGNVRWVAVDKYMPLFHTLSFPKLSLFQMYLRNIYDEDRHQSYEGFVRNIPVNEITAIHQRISNLLLEIDSTEIVDEEGLLKFTKAILKIHKGGGFEKKETAIGLLNDYRLCIKRMKEWSAKGDKNGNGKFKLYTGSHLVQEGAFLFYNEDGPTVLISKLINNFFILTKDLYLVNDAANDLSAMKSRNTCMCGLGGIKRNEFFNNLLRKIQETETQLH